MRTIICILAAFSLLLTAACERQTETTAQPQEQQQATQPQPQEQAAQPQEGQQAGGEGQPAGELERLPGIQEVQYQIDLETGARVYQQACASCHAEGVAGAPKMGDTENWQPRIEKGMPALVRNSIEGFQGNQGVMPPKGGVQSLTDDEVASAAAYIAMENLE